MIIHTFISGFGTSRPAKGIILSSVLCLLLSSSPVFAASPRKALEQTTPASDRRITFVGRTVQQGSDVSFDWSGVYARIRFRGTYLAMRASDTHRNYYNVWIDRPMSEEPDKVISTHGTDSLIVLMSAEEAFERGGRKKLSPDSGEHLVVIQKRTEGEQGKTTVHSFLTTGDMLQAEGIRDRVIEIVGDSYTCGYGSENSVRSDPFKPETENCNKSYSCIVPRYFGAEYIHVAHSGMGIARNYNDNVKGWYMPERYLQSLDMDRESRWTPQTGVKPDITIIYLGTNDFSTSRQPTMDAFVRGYITLLQEIKDNYGEAHPILCMASKADYYLSYCIHEVMTRCGMLNVSFGAFGDMIHDNDSDLGASWHPNYQGHRKISMGMIPYVSTMTGWPLADNPIK